MRNDIRRYYDGEKMEMATTEKPPCLLALPLIKLYPALSLDRKILWDMSARAFVLASDYRTAIREALPAYTFILFCEISDPPSPSSSSPCAEGTSYDAEIKVLQYLFDYQSDDPRPWGHTRKEPDDCPRGHTQEV